MGVLRRDRDFRRLWIGQSISVAGSQVGAVALPLVATLTLHAGAAGVSAVATAAYLPDACDSPAGRAFAAVAAAASRDDRR